VDTEPFYTSQRQFGHEIQYYFRASLRAGAEPIWQEKYKQTDTDQYAFIWIGLNFLSSLIIYPEDVKQEVVSRLLELK
jgi:hypothetical protein